MKYSPHIYAEAFWQMVDEKKLAQTELCRNFLETVERHGELSRLDQIAAEIEATGIRRSGGNQVLLEFARPVSEGVVEAFRKKLSDKDILKTSVDEKLVAGVRITINGKRELDNTILKRLNKVFAS